MSLSKTCFIIPTWRVYPRVFYFISRYNGLVPRFKRMIKAFPSSFHEKFLMTNVEKIEKEFQNAFDVIVLGYDSLELEDILVTIGPWKQDGFKDLQMTPCITMYVCYIVIDRLDETGWKKVSSTLEFFIEQYGNTNICAFESLFIVIETAMTAETEKMEFSEHITRKIELVYPEWRHYDREKVLYQGHGQKGLIRDQLSIYLESKVMLGFHYILNHLQMFLRLNKKSVPTSIDISDHIKEENSIAKILQNYLFIKEVQSLAETEESEELFGKTIDEKFVHILCTRLAICVKCRLVDIASIKFNLVPWQINLLLNELKFENLIVDSISDSTKTDLRKLNVENEEMLRKNRAWVKARKELSMSINNSLIVDITKTVLTTDSKLKNMTSATTVMDKMVLEVKGYLSETITDFKLDMSAPPVISDALRRQLLEIKDVFGVGTIYNTLEVHVQNNSSEVRENIDHLMKKHSFASQYIVKPVNQQFQRYDNIVPENGAMIKSIFTTQDNKTEVKTGTLGCFVQDDHRNVYALTSAHVIARPHVQPSEVFIQGKSLNATLLGKSHPELTIYSGESSLPVMDIAAITVTYQTASSCKIYPKDDQGFNCRGDLFTENLFSLYRKFVFKHGAISALTKGIVCSTDFSVLNYDDYLIMIENLPGSDGPFACQGDSGSVICCPDITSNQVKLISMLIGGDYKVDGDLSPKYLTFSLRHGLKHLTDKSGIRFYVP